MTATIFVNIDFDSVKRPIPHAVKRTVKIHHNCLVSSTATVAPGSFGGKPNEGAKEKTKKPIKPQNNPEIISTDFPLIKYTATRIKLKVIPVTILEKKV